MLELFTAGRCGNSNESTEMVIQHRRFGIGPSADLPSARNLGDWGWRFALGWGGADDFSEYIFGLVVLKHCSIVARRLFEPLSALL